MTNTPTFKDENRALQELARELALLRKHNLTFRQGDSQHDILMFAEAALVCMTLEHFVRVVLGPLGEAPDGKGFTLQNLLEKAVAEKLIRLPSDDQQEGIRRVCSVRNELLHANYAESARRVGCASVGNYFRERFAREIEDMFGVVDHIMQQIDPTTGRPRPQRP